MDIIGIIKALKIYKVTQVQIAREIGCTQPNVSILSKYKTEIPSHKTVSGLMRLCEKYGIDITNPCPPPRIAKSDCVHCNTETNHI